MMGTRADFYVGRGNDADWIGSIAWDGYRDGIPDDVLGAVNEDEYRERVGNFLAGRDDATTPADGWPWPWDNSCTTDCAYCFDAGSVHGYTFGSPYEDEDEGPIATPTNWPDMRERKNVALGNRSGTIMVSSR